MFNWFGRKSAPAARVGVPWLQENESGFARGIEGAQLLVRATGETMVRRNGSWEAGVVRAHEVQVDGLTVLSARQAPIAAPAGGSVIDAESRSAISAILSALQAHGLIGS